MLTETMKYLLLPLLFLFSLDGSGQATGGWPDKYLKGYTASVKGGGFGYHSPQPEVNTSLLVRSIDSVQYIEWFTEPVSTTIPANGLSFIWIFGIDATAEGRTFTLFVNGQRCLSFKNPPVADLKPRVITDPSGATLTFRTTMIDKYEDAMGYAILHLPASMINPGERQSLKIFGESAGKPTWYMTFEAPVEENLTVRQEEVVIRGAEHNHFSVVFHFVRLKDEIGGTLKQSDGTITAFTLHPGYNRVQLMVPETDTPALHTALLTLEGENPREISLQVVPVRHWNIYLVQHTHTDIGYTRPQTEILPEHLRYIDYALDYCDQTDSLPNEAKFRWTCETSWAVQEYLKTRPETQIERLKRRVGEGRIELTALYLNSSDLADEPTIAASLKPIALFRNMGLPVQAAMQSDINGVPWALTDYLPAAGINYLNMAQNTHRALKPFSIPTTFWWESPSGNRLLVNRPEHYMWANNLGILTNITTFGNNLLSHLHTIREQGYPFDHYAIQFSGYLTDNSPPSTTACHIVETWNSRYVWPRLELATISTFPSYMKQNHGTELPVIRGAWPDWWMDGFGSAAIPTAFARKAHADYIANQGLRSMAALLSVPSNDHIVQLNEEILDDIAFYDEHTFGAAESISDPLCENSVVQLGEKVSYVWDAVKKNYLLREEVMGRVQPLLQRRSEPVITLFNTLNWPRSGNATLYIDHQILPRDGAFTILDPAGHEVPAQRLAAREDGSYWSLFVEEVPAMGFLTLRIKNKNERRLADAEPPFSGILENDYYRMVFNTATGSIVSLQDKQLHQELVDTGARYGLGAFIYEKLGKNRGQLEQRRFDEFTRETWREIKVSQVRQGAVWKSITLTGQVPGCADASGVSCEVRLYNHEKKVEFHYAMKKLAVTDPEGVYVAFPLLLNDGKTYYEVAGGTVEAWKDQIPGSASDWQGIQNFVAIRNSAAQILFVSPEIPLVQLGDINMGRFNPLSDPDQTHPSATTLYSWVLNNYWTTNFLASQEGELKWSYQITSSSDTSNLFATQFGWGNRIPMLTRIFPAGKGDTSLIPRSFGAANMSHLLLVCATPAADNGSITLQLREVNGKADSVIVESLLLSSISLAMATQATSISEVNVIGEVIKPVWQKQSRAMGGYTAAQIYFKPNETKFLKVVLR